MMCQASINDIKSFNVDMKVPAIYVIKFHAFSLSHWVNFWYMYETLW